MTQALDTLKVQVLRAAALRGPFEPRALLKDVLSPEDYGDKVQRARLISLLHAHCTVETTSPGSPVQWLLRASTRERALDGYENTGAQPETDIAAALNGSGLYDPVLLKDMITTSRDEKALSESVITLEHAGSKAPGHEHLVGLRSRLNAVRRSRQTDAVLGDEFIGRTEELNAIEAWIAAPQSKPPLRSLHIMGIPGIGKSFLLERIVQIAGAQPDLILVRLDFDRSSLQIGAGGTVYDEISRQIGEALPQKAAYFRSLRMAHSERVTRTGHDTADLIPRELLHAMIDVVEQAGRCLIILLDTLEVLQAQGATYVETLMEELDRFADTGRIDIAVISAGRAPIFTESDPRNGGHLPLTKVETVLIREVLRQKSIPEEVWPDIINEAKGNPLRLRLLISVVKSQSAADAAQVLGQAHLKGLDRGFVHRVIRARLPEHLRRIANEGLVLHELTVEALVNILAPALGLGDLRSAAPDLIAELALRPWFVTDTGRGRLVPKADLRQEVLEHIYRDNPEDTAAVNRAARDYFAGRDPVQHLYHAAQLMRIGEAPPEIEPGLADRFPDRLLNELPIEAQDHIRHARGQRSATQVLVADDLDTRGYDAAGLAAPDAGSQPKLVRIDPRSATGRARVVKGRGFAGRPDPRAVMDLRAILEQGERREATHILREGLPGEYAPTSEVGVLILCHQWLTGHWSKARELFELLPEAALPDLAKGNPQLEGRIALEILAEFKFGKLVEWLHDETFRDCAVNVMRSSNRIGLQGAALDFALLAAGVTVEGQQEALGTLAPYLRNGRIELSQERLRLADSIRGDCGLKMAPVDLSDIKAADGRYALAIAPINPYYDRLFALASEMQVAGKGRLLDDLRTLAGGIREAADLFGPALEGLDHAISQAGDRPLDILALIRSLGITADWAEGYSFFHPIPDLPTLARALSRWQQTTAGYWAYDSAPPKDWAPGRDWGAVTELRIASLTDKQGTSRADRMLSFWADPLDGNPGKGTDTLTRRLSAPFSKVSVLKDISGRMRYLIGSRVPAVFRPAIATLPDKDARLAYFQ